MAQTPANDFERRVEQRLADLDAPELPGYAYAVIEDGEIVHSGEHGLIELGGKALVRSDTAFPIGSISKSFTALAIMQLVEAGEVDLDAPASRYLERFADTPAARVTIRQLLSHTSGFSTVQGNLTQSNFSMAPDALEQRVDGLTPLAALRVRPDEHALGAGADLPLQRWRAVRRRHPPHDPPGVDGEGVPDAVREEFPQGRPDRPGLSAWHLAGGEQPGFDSPLHRLVGL